MFGRRKKLADAQAAATLALSTVVKLNARHAKTIKDFNERVDLLNGRLTALERLVREKV